MRIIICEDDLSQRQFIQNEIIKHASFNLPSVEIVLAASSVEEVIS